jgi:hypothetical protein
MRECAKQYNQADLWREFGLSNKHVRNTNANSSSCDIAKPPPKTQDVNVTARGSYGLHGIDAPEEN